MRVAFITRSTLYEIHGGSTVQAIETARQLRVLGIEVDICLAHEKIQYEKYDLLHFFDIIRPANFLTHINKCNLPFVVSPVLVDYSEYDKHYRKGIAGKLFRLFSADTNEYLKTVGRWLIGKDSLPGKTYLWKGHKRSMLEVLQKASLLLPNSANEYNRLVEICKIEKEHIIVPNGVDTDLFGPNEASGKDDRLIICAARIEGIKNTHNLVKAMNNTVYKLIIIGEASPNQPGYLAACQEIAADNIQFTGRLPQVELVNYYRKAKVHVLPSWFETCGLSSLEAAAMGCNIVISDRGFVRDYFGDDAFYCDPSDCNSIFQAVESAANSPSHPILQQNVLENFTWEKAAAQTLAGYTKVLCR